MSYIQVITENPYYIKSRLENWEGCDSYNVLCNFKIASLFPPGERLRVLDVGCGGGSFIEEFVNDGHDAVGVDGDINYSLHQFNAWERIPNNLFHANVCRPYEILIRNAEAKFNVITSWHLLEYIPELRIPFAIYQMTEHLAINGLMIHAVSLSQSGGVLASKPVEWWLLQFAKFGLRPVNLPHQFEKEDLLDYKEDSVYFILSHNDDVNMWHFHLMNRLNPMVQYGDQQKIEG